MAGGGGGFADHIISGSTNVYVNSATSTISSTTNGSVANYFDASGRLIITGISVTTNQMSATTGYFSGKVGVGTTSPLKKLSVVASSSGDGISIEGSSASGFSPQLSLVSDSTIKGALVYAQVAGHGISNAVAGDFKSNDTAGSLLLATSIDSTRSGFAWCNGANPAIVIANAAASYSGGFVCHYDNSPNRNHDLYWSYNGANKVFTWESRLYQVWPHQTCGHHHGAAAEVRQGIAPRLSGASLDGR